MWWVAPPLEIFSSENWQFTEFQKSRKGPYFMYPSYEMVNHNALNVLLIEKKVYSSFKLCTIFGFVCFFIEEYVAWKLCQMTIFQVFKSPIEAKITICWLPWQPLTRSGSNLLTDVWGQYTSISHNITKIHDSPHSSLWLIFSDNGS